MAENHFKVLIVDDDDFFRRVVIHAIKKSNAFPHATFIEAENGQVAWEKIESQHPNVVILDVVMPVMDGVTLAEKIKETYPQLPILVLTGQADLAAKDKLTKQIGVNGYVIKGHDMAEFIDEVVRVFPLPAFKT